MDKEFSLIRWKLIIALTVGSIFAVLAAFLVLTTLICRQRIKMTRKRKEMLAKRMSRRHWLMEQNSHVMNHLRLHSPPVDGSIPLPRSSPGFFNAPSPSSIPHHSSTVLGACACVDDACTLMSGNISGESSRSDHAFSYLPFCFQSRLNSSAIQQQSLNKTSSRITAHSHVKRREHFPSWQTSPASSFFDNIESTAPSLHRSPERSTQTSSNGGIPEEDSGFSNLSDMNQNFSPAISDDDGLIWTQRQPRYFGVQSVNNNYSLFSFYRPVGQL